mmetsp:Transcript_12231/g.33376  ORF Transcript_12231/g.33376 Transcript_12231/m.33376 type:complete len:80 (+) Transcript_12231:1151-1390(+)
MPLACIEVHDGYFAAFKGSNRIARVAGTQVQPSNTLSVSTFFNDFSHCMLPSQSMPACIHASMHSLLQWAMATGQFFSR